MKRDLLINEARLKLLQATSAKKLEEDSQGPPKKKLPEKSGDFLQKAIETAQNCLALIPKEEERIKTAITAIQANKEKDKFWETRVSYLQDNLDHMKLTYPMFAKEAKRRKLHYEEVNRKNRWAIEKEKCINDTHYWFDNYAWTADPRKTGLWSLPFMLYDFQRETVDWLESLIFVRQENGLIEKSRDLGLSWLISALFYKHWQHPKDGSFQALVGSITASECDTIGDPSSLFEKLRIQSRLQPQGLLPKGWDGNIPYMKAINPENGSTITGENASGDFGRSGRYKCLVGNTLIHTPKGIRTIKEMLDDVDSEILSPDGKVKKIKNYIVRPPEKTYKVKLRGGFEITGTSDHPLMAVTSSGLVEKSISELKFRDKLRLVPLATAGSETMSLDLARVLGYLVSEGYVARIDGKFDFVNADDEILEDYKNSWYQVYKATLREIKGTSTSSVTGKISNWKTITINNVEIRRELASLGLDYVKSAYKTIPIAVRMGTPEIKKAFLQSLFEGDGGIYWDTSGNPRVSYTSKSLELLKQIQVMLLEFGIIATKNKSNVREEHKLNLISYQAYLFGQKIGFRGARKSSLLPKNINPKWKVKPFDIEVLSVEEDGFAPTYDLECEDHLFVANGIISHNCILFDEFSAFEQDTQALTASSQSSPCRIFNSTARGTGNEFYRLRGTGSIEVKTLHWTQHPFKSQTWYDYQKLTMNPVMVAQELDIDYNASQPNKVYPDYNEAYHVVTQSEVMRALPSFRDSKGKFRIPIGHKVVMGEDVGQTEDHAHVLLWFVTLKEGTVTVDGIDLSGSVLMYREIVLPPHTTPRKGAMIIKEAESSNYEHMLVYDRMISQEALTERDIYEEEYGLSFRHWKPDYNTGIARVRDYLEVTNLHQPHPFREATRADKYPNGLPIMGRPSLFLVSDDAQGELHYNQTLQNYTVHMPEDNKGLIRTRFEFPAYHYASSEVGKEVKKMRPKKTFDDCFVEGTLITTNKGQVPIEILKSGDMVLTRKGYKPVKDCVMTHKISDIYRLEFSDGRELLGTKNHPIFSSDDFVPMDVLRCGDKVTTLEETLWNLSHSTASSTEDTQTLNTNLIELITPAESTTKNKVSAISTEIYGDSTMERYPKTATFTIKTLILRIMIFLTLNALARKITQKPIQNVKFLQRENYIWTRSEISLLLGINPRKGESGIERWQRQGQKLLLQNNIDVGFASKTLKVEDKVELNSVPVHVRKRATDTGLRLPVWNLEVEECHEYFANGILVHNCMDVVRCVATDCFAPISPLTDEERYEKGLPDNLKRDNLDLLPLEDRGMAFIQRQIEKRQYNENYVASTLNYRDRLFKKATDGKSQ